MSRAKIYTWWHLLYSPMLLQRHRVIFLSWVATWTPLCIDTIDTDKNNAILNLIVSVNVGSWSLQNHHRCVRQITDTRQRKLRRALNIPRFDLAGEAQSFQMDDLGRVSNKDQDISFLNNYGRSSGPVMSWEQLEAQNVRKREPLVGLEV